MALQHLRSSTANKRPVPGNMSDGQLGINTNTGSPGLFFKDSNNTLVKVGPVHVGTTAPNASPASGGTAGNSVGEQWLDTSGGTYVFKVWDGSAWRSESGTFVDVNGDVMTGALGIIAGSAAAPGLYISGDTNTGLYSPGADQLALSTNGTGRLFIDSSGRVGIGTTPDSRLHVQGLGSASGYTSAGNAGLKVDFGTSANGVINLVGGADLGIYRSNTSGAYDVGIGFGDNSNRILRFDTAGSERARIDSSGRLLVGTSSARANYFNSTATTQLQIEKAGGGGGVSVISDSVGDDPAILILGKSNNASVGGNTAVAVDNFLGTVSFQGNDGSEFVDAARISCYVDGTPGVDDMPGRLVFSTTADGASSPTERMRITNNGQTRILGGSAPLTVRTTLAAGTSDYIFLGYRSATNMTDGVDVIDIFTNGNVVNTNNSYGAISDVKLKENIVDSGSQWSDLKSLRVRKYNFKEETGRDVHTQIGLIAQEVELVSPGLVSESPDRNEDGNDLGTVTKSVNYSVLYMKAVKALQEAMERIEQLEQRLAAAGI